MPAYSKRAKPFSSFSDWLGVDLSWPTRSCPESASPSCPTFLTRSYSVTMFCMAVLEHTVGSYKSKAPGRFRFRPWSSKANLRPRSRCLSGRPDARWRPSIFLSKTFLILRSPSLCSPGPTVTLEGKISPASLLGDKNANVSVNYMAGWACGFFGLAVAWFPRFRWARLNRMPKESSRSNSPI